MAILFSVLKTEPGSHPQCLFLYPVSFQSPKQGHFTFLLSLAFIFVSPPYFLPGFLLSYPFLACLHPVLPAAVTVLFQNHTADPVGPHWNVSVVPVAPRRSPEHLRGTRECPSFISPLSFLSSTLSLPYWLLASMASARLECLSPSNSLL